MSSSSLSDSMRARGTMMSCTVTAPTSKRLSRIARCFFGMKLEDSSTRVRISSVESFGASPLWSVRMRSTHSSGRTNRFTNQAAGSSTFSVTLSGSESSSAVRSGCVAPITLGVISANTMIRNEITSVPIAYASLSCPRNRTATRLESVLEAAMTRVLPMRMPPRRRSVRLSSSATRIALSSPCVTRCFRR